MGCAEALIARKKGADEHFARACFEVKTSGLALHYSKTKANSKFDLSIYLFVKLIKRNAKNCSELLAVNGCLIMRA